MEALEAALEKELEGAFEVKDRESLHRCVRLLAEELVQRQIYERDSAEAHADIRLLVERMDLGFKESSRKFEELTNRMDERFDQMDKRFEDLIHQMDERFEQTDKRFEDLIHQMDERFEQTDKRFDHMFRLMSVGFTVLVVLVTIYNFL